MRSNEKKLLTGYWHRQGLGYGCKFLYLHWELWEVIYFRNVVPRGQVYDVDIHMPSFIFMLE